MDYEFELHWKKTLDQASKDFGEDLDMQSLLLLIGFQESGQDLKKFNKNQKIDLMHVAICTLLAPFGYYKFVGTDEELWPHFERVENLPPLNEEEQDRLIKRSIIKYFNYSLSL